MDAPNKRRIVLIDHRFQFRMAGIFIALQILLTAVFAAGLYLFVDSEIHADLASAHASTQSLNQMLLPIVVVLSAFSISISVILATIFVTVISHKIAGPMYRFNAVLDLLANRQFSHSTQVRPGDQLGALSTSLGNAISTVKLDLGNIQTAVDRLRATHTSGDMHALENEITTIENTLRAWHHTQRGNN